jgi:hypothetical protein
MPDSTQPRSVTADRPARHERPRIDDAALEAARHADRLLAAAREGRVDRWVVFLEPIPGRLRDDDLRQLPGTARRARAAYGPKDSIRDALPLEVTEPFLDALDRLLKVIAREEASGA